MGDNIGGKSLTSGEYRSARFEVDTMIKRLWCSFRKLSDYGEEAMTEQDLTLWGEITSHRAVQDKLKEVY